MTLTKVRVTDFQSVRDSTEFDVGDVTCLVGKNEAGKTALLQAMYRLLPIVDTEDGYSVTDDYPRRDVADYEYEIEEKKREHVVVGHLTYELDEAEATAIAKVFGPKALTSRTLTISKAYERHDRRRRHVLGPRRRFTTLEHTSSAATTAAPWSARSPSSSARCSRNGPRQASTPRARKAGSAAGRRSSSPTSNRKL